MLDQIVTEIPFWVWEREGEVPEAIWEREFEADRGLIVRKEGLKAQSERIARIVNRMKREHEAIYGHAKKVRG